jgi:hypothetical protein
MDTMVGDSWLDQICAGTTELTTESLFWRRRPRSEEIAAATGALQALNLIEAEQPAQPEKTREIDARVLFDPRLIAHKDALRRYLPVRVRCRCGRSLEWIAIAPLGDHGLQLVHGPRLFPPGERRGGAFDIEPGTKMSPVGQGPAIGTATWAQDSDAGVGHSRTVPNGPYGNVYALKAEYRCPKCHSRETVLHVSLLRRFLTAVVLGEKEVRLGPLPGVAPPSKPQAERVPDRQGAMAWSSRAARRKR